MKIDFQLMTANVKNILKNANLTEADGKDVLENIGVAAELVPFFKEKLVSSLSSARTVTSANSSDSMSSELSLLLITKNSSSKFKK